MPAADTIRAIVASPDEPTGLAVREVAAPTPATHEALVCVAAVGLNLGEVKGAPQQPPGRRLGWDFAGTVEAGAPDGSGPPAGTRVVGILEDGAWAQRVAVPTRAVAELPAGVSFSQAATLPLAGLTAWLALEKAGPVLQRRVLVTGASHGGGFFVLQLAAAGGAEVVTFVQDAAGADHFCALGASEVLVAQQDPAEFAPYDAILDSRGGDSLAKLMPHLAPQGVVVTYLASSSAQLTFDLRAFIQAGGARLYGLTTFYELRRTPAADGLQRLATMADRGALQTVVGEETSWSELQEVALRVVSKDRRPGTTVLLLD